MSNDGFANVEDIISYLDKKKFCTLNDNFKNFISYIFAKDIPFNTVLAVKKHRHSNEKPDIFIKIELLDSVKYVSIKKGSGNSVHQENINDFINFLTTLGLESRPLNILKKYHWSDGSDDNTGLIRQPSKTYRKNNLSDINFLNNILNEKRILLSILNRVLFQGKNRSFKHADCIYYGTIDSGIWATRKEIIDYCVENVFTKDCLHFGPLTYQTWNLNINRREDMEKRRKSMQVKWGTLKLDLETITRKRNVK